jgi:hypothetical protein
MKKIPVTFCNAALAASVAPNAAALMFAAITLKTISPAGVRTVTPTILAASRFCAANLRAPCDSFVGFEMAAAFWRLAAPTGFFWRRRSVFSKWQALKSRIPPLQQHRTSDVPRLVEALVERGVAYALGSRFLGSSRGMPYGRRLLLQAAIWLTRVMTGLSLTDTHNGLRAMTREGASRIALRQNRMAHASELLEQIAASGLPHMEVPVTIDYTRYSLAKGQRLSDSLAILFDLSAQKLQR